MTEVSVPIIGDLEAEQLELQAVVASIDADAWLAPTPAWGWDVRDTIAHLADTDEMAIDTALGGPYAINDVAGQAGDDRLDEDLHRTGRRVADGEDGAAPDRDGAVRRQSCCSVSGLTWWALVRRCPWR